MMLFQTSNYSPCFAEKKEGQEEEETESTTSSEITEPFQKKIKELKERLATRVAELSEQNKKSFYGVIKKASDTEYTLGFDTVELIVKPTQSAKYYKISSKDDLIEIPQKDLEQGQNTSAFGFMDLDQKTLIADLFMNQTLPIIDKGTITSVNTKKGVLTYKGESGENSLDYEITTRCSKLKDDFSTENCGLSKVEVGDYAFVRYLPLDSEKTTGIASRIFVIPYLLLADNNISILTPALSEPSPATNSSN
jgi:hypothetical protein